MRFILILLLSINLFSSEVIYPIPTSVNYDIEKAKLGKKLFFDTRLSKDKSISCNSCHDLTLGGADSKKYSIGISGLVGNINSPTVYNAVFNFKQFWNGRVDTLEDQVAFPIENSHEMGHSFDILVKDIQNDNFYSDKFAKLYPKDKKPVNKKNISNAIAEFEKTLITPNSQFDKFLKGDNSALTIKQKSGYQIFLKKGCISCHNGINIGGNLYAKLGTAIEAKQTETKGLYEITKNKKDMYMFKVPSLRNVMLTSPYGHSGDIKNIEDAISGMAYHQTGTILKQSEIADLIEFFKSLTGEKRIIND